MNHTEDIETRVQHINELHDSLRAIGDTVAELTYQAGLKHREIGIKLATLKDDLKKDRKWLALFRTAKGKEQLASTLTFDYTTGRRYVQIAALFPDRAPTFEEFKDKWNGIRAIWGNVACLPDVERETQNKSGIGWKSKLSLELGAALEILTREVNKSTIDRWEPEDCVHLIRETDQIFKLRTAAEERLAALGIKAA